MQFRDLQKQYQILKEEIDKNMQEVLTAGNFISGKQVGELEKQLADYVGIKHCISCANGTDAITLALMALNVGEGDAVFVPDFTFFSTGECPAYEGAAPIFVDIDENTFNMNPQSLQSAIDAVLKEGKLIPKVIIPVDLFGQPANFDEIKKIADKYNLYVIEDAAQGFGGEIRGQKACSFGDIATTSFFPAKPLGCYGDGGAIFTNDDEIADLLKSLRVHGKGSDKYDNIRLGMNSRLDTLQAAILQVKLKAFSEYELTDVNKIAQRYTELLTNLPTSYKIQTPFVKEGFVSSWAQYSVLLENKEQRDGLQAYLKEKGIPSMIYYVKPMHNQGAFKEIKTVYTDLSITEDVCNRILALPMHPYLNEEDQNYIVGNIATFLEK